MLKSNHMWNANFLNWAHFFIGRNRKKLSPRIEYTDTNYTVNKLPELGNLPNPDHDFLF